jgi:hypothetical protein
MFGWLQRLTSALGLAICLYFLYEYHYVGLCIGHCNPNYYAFGSLWFASGIVVRGWIVKAWSVVGILGIVYFVVLEILTGFCLPCTTLHLIGITAIAFAQKDPISRLLRLKAS